MTRTNLALTALAIGPLAVAADMAISYYLVYPAQASGSKLGLHVTTACCAVVAIVAIVLSRRALARDAREIDRFLAISGIAMNAFWFLVILGFEVPKIIHHVSD